MDILPDWLGPLAVFLIAFPIVMLGLPFLVATLRQRLTWNRRQPADAGLRGLPPGAGGAERDPAPGRPVRYGRSRGFSA
jgi:hypothetical protein